MRAHVMAMILCGSLGACTVGSDPDAAPPPARVDAAQGVDAPIDAVGDHDSALADASVAAIDSANPADSGDPDACTVSGAPGECMSTSACTALGNHTSYAGHCPGSADIQCCIVTPNTANNPPFPPGYKLMAQADVTPAMTTWAVAILNDPTDYPMFSTAMMMFGTLNVLAQVEWHPPDFQNSVVHRGVTLFEPE